jgi:hypothetical protein
MHSVCFEYQRTYKLLPTYDSEDSVRSIKKSRKISTNRLSLPILVTIRVSALTEGLSWEQVESNHQGDVLQTRPETLSILPLKVVGVGIEPTIFCI